MSGGKPEDYICLHKIKWWMNRNHIEDFVSKFGKLLEVNFVQDDGNSYDRKCYIRFKVKPHIGRLRSAIENCTFNDDQPSFEILSSYPSIPKSENTAVKQLLQGQKAPKFFEDAKCVVPFCPEDFNENVRPFYKTGVKPFSNKTIEPLPVDRTESMEFVDAMIPPEKTPSGNEVQPLTEDKPQTKPIQTVTQPMVMNPVVAPVVVPGAVMAGSFLPQPLMMQQPLVAQMMIPQPVQLVPEPVRRREPTLRTIPRITDLSDPMLPRAPRDEFMRRERDPLRGEFVRERFRERRRDFDPIRDPIRDSMRDPIREPMRDPIRDPIRDSIRDPMRDPMREPMREPIRDPMRESMRDPIREPMRESYPRDFRDPPRDYRDMRDYRDPRDYYMDPREMDDPRDFRDPRAAPRDYRWDPIDREPRISRDPRPPRKMSPPRRDPGYYDRRREDEFVRREWR